MKNTNVIRLLLIARYNKKPFSSLQDLKDAFKVLNMPRRARLQEGHMALFAHEYLVKELLKGNKIQDLEAAICSEATGI